MNSAGLKFVSDIGRRITQVSKDNRESAFLFQRLSVLITMIQLIRYPWHFCPHTH